MLLFILVRINNDKTDKSPTNQQFTIKTIYKESQSRSLEVTKHLFNRAHKQMYGKLI